MKIGYPALGQVGRLGNQLWQVASTVGLARTRGTEPQFPPGWAYRPWFSLPEEWYGTGDATPATELVGGPPAARPYLQDLALWAHVADEVRAALAPSPRAVAVLDRQESFAALPRPVLSVHVRRGDNAHDPLTPDKWRYHPLRPLRYYREAMELLADGAGSVACFGDDPEWSKQHIPADFYGDGRSRWDWVDLLLGARAQRFVISNSTFAWWSAWLSGSDRVVYPWPWYGPALADLDASRMMPDGWTRLDHGPYVPGEE